MADLIAIKSGAKGDRETLPKLFYDAETGSELGYCTDEQALYIGTKDGNMRLCGVEDVGRLYALLEDITTRLEALEKPSE